MQREIEALIRAYHEEQARETRLIQDVLAALAVGASSRRLMIEELAAVVGRAKNDMEPTTREHPAQFADALTTAVRPMRVS